MVWPHGPPVGPGKARDMIVEGDREAFAFFGLLVSRMRRSL